jgi:hypothetical protein
MDKDSGGWEAVGPWAPSNEELGDAVKAAWSLVRLQWENVAHEERAVEHPESDDAMIGIYEQYDARTLVIALTIVGGALAMSGEVMLGFPGEAMSHERAHEEIRRRLMGMHGLDWPQGWD